MDQWEWGIWTFLNLRNVFFYTKTLVCLSYRKKQKQSILILLSEESCRDCCVIPSSSPDFPQIAVYIYHRSSVSLMLLCLCILIWNQKATVLWFFSPSKPTSLQIKGSHRKEIYRVDSCIESDSSVCLMTYVRNYIQMKGKPCQYYVSNCGFMAGLRFLKN